MTDHKQYVNVDPARANERREIRRPRAGKTVHLAARINKQVEGVPIIFEIKSGRHNVNRALEDANFSPGERRRHARQRASNAGFQNPGIARRRVLTDAQGEATIDFILSENGGDEFEVKAFIRGQESNELLSDKFIVWRRVYYQVSRFRQSRQGVGRRGVLTEIPNFSWGSIVQEFRDRRHNIELEDESSRDLIDRIDANVITRANNHRTATRRARDGYNARREPLAMRVVLVNMIAKSETVELTFNQVRENQPRTLRIPRGRKLWIDKSKEIKTDFLVDAQWRYEGGRDRAWRNLDAQYVSAVGNNQVRVEMDRIPRRHVFHVFRRVEIKLTVRVNKGNTNGLSWYNTIWIAHRIMHRGVRATNLKKSTTVHETGHFIGMAASGQSTHYTGRGHTGPHCSTGLSAANRARSSYRGMSGTCVMFGESAPGRSGRFCSTCDPFVRTRRIRLRRMPRSW